MKQKHSRERKKIDQPMTETQTQKPTSIHPLLWECTERRGCGRKMCVCVSERRKKWREKQKERGDRQEEMWGQSTKRTYGNLGR